MRKSLLLAVALAALSTAAPASAAMYSFNFSGANFFGSPANAIGSGVFTTSDVATSVLGRTAFSITSITGMVNGSAINAPNTGASYGNYFTTGGTFLDGTGLRFFTNAGNDVRFFFQDTVSQYRVNTFSPGASAFVTATSAALPAVPEPGAWAMLILGFGGVGLAMRRRPRPLVALAVLA